MSYERAEAHHYHSSVAGAFHEVLQISRKRRWMPVHGKPAH